jgi:WD40 repeat protein
MSRYTDKIHAHDGAVVGLHFLDADRLLTVSQTGGLRVCDVRRLVMLKNTSLKVGGSKTLVVRTAVSPDGNRLLVSAKDGSMTLWVLGESGPTTQEATFPADPNTPFRITPDGRHIVWVSDCRIHLTPVGGSVPVTLQRHRDRVTGLAVSPDGGTVVSLDNSGGIIAYDLVQNRIAQEGNWRVGGIVEMAFSPDGKRLMIADQASHIYLCDSGRLGVEPYVFSWCTHPLVRTAYSPDGGYIANVCGDGRTYLFTAEGKRVECLQGNERPLSGMTWRPDSRQVVTGGQDGFVLVWPVKPPMLVA